MIGKKIKIQQSSAGYLLYPVDVIPELFLDTLAKYEGWFFRAANSLWEHFMAVWSGPGLCGSRPQMTPFSFLNKSHQLLLHLKMSLLNNILNK